MRYQNLHIAGSSFDHLYDNCVKPFNKPWLELVAQLTQSHPEHNDSKSKIPAFNGWHYKLPTDPTVSFGNDPNGKPLRRFSTHYTRRIQPNLIEASLLILDFDGGLPLTEARSRFTQYEHVGYTSFNHGGDGVDKYRLVFPFGVPMPMAEFKRRVESIRRWVEGDGVAVADPASYVLNQLFLLPAVRSMDSDNAQTWHQSGDLLNWRDFEAMSDEDMALHRYTNAQQAINQDGLFLEPDMILRTRSSAIRVADIVGKVSHVECPFHEDRNPTEFAGVTDRGLPYLRCKKCGTVYMRRLHVEKEDPLLVGIAKLEERKRQKHLMGAE